MKSGGFKFAREGWECGAAISLEKDGHVGLLFRIIWVTLQCGSQIFVLDSIGEDMAYFKLNLM